MPDREVTAPPSGVDRQPRVAGLVLLLYLILAVLLTAGAWRDPGGRLVGASQDAIQHIWFLRWLPFALAHGLDPLLTRYLDHPGPVNLMWNNATPLLALLAAPITLTAGPVVAYAALLTAAIALSAWSAYLLAARLVRHRAAAAAAGLAYGFSPYVVAQASGSHLPLVTVAVPPLLLLGLHELAVRRRMPPARVGWLLGGLLAAQLVTNEELLLTEALMGAVTVLLLAALHPARLRPGVAVGRTAAVRAVYGFTVLGAVPLIVQFLGPGRLGGGPVQPPGRYVVDLLGFVVPTRVLHFAPAGAVALSRRFSANLSEWDAYLGVPLLVVVVVAPFVIRRRWAVAAALAGLAAAILSLGPSLHVGGRAVLRPLPWAWLSPLPGFRDVLPDRLSVYVFLAAALLLGGVLDRCRERLGPGAGWLRFTTVAAAALLPLVPSGPLPSRPALVPAFFRTPSVERLPVGRMALVAPAAWGPDDTAMLWQALSGMRFSIPSGYVLHPGPRGAAVADPTGNPLTATLEALQRGDAVRLPPLALRRLRRRALSPAIAAVVVGPMPGRARVLALLERLLGRRPAAVGGVDLWLTGAPSRRVGAG